MRRAIALFCTAAAVIGGGASSAHSKGKPPSPGAPTRFAYTQHDVTVHRARLRNELVVVGFGSGIRVLCRGERPVSLADGTTGFLQIRCTTNAHILDFVYHRDGRGREHLSRVPRR